MRKSEKVVIRMTPADKTKLKQAAEKHGLDLSTWARYALAMCAELDLKLVPRVSD